MRGEGLCNLNDHYPNNVRLDWVGGLMGPGFGPVLPSCNRSATHLGDDHGRCGGGVDPQAVTPSPLGSICARQWGDPAAAPNPVPTADVLLSRRRDPDALGNRGQREQLVDQPGSPFELVLFFRSRRRQLAFDLR